MDTTTATAVEPRSALSYESGLFTNAYSAARDAYVAYSSVRSEEYLAALRNVAVVVEEADDALDDARSDAERAHYAAERSASEAWSSMLTEIEVRRDRSWREFDAYQDEVRAILDVAREQAELDGSNAYQVWSSAAHDRVEEAKRSQLLHEDTSSGVFERIAGGVAARLTFDPVYLAALDAAVTAGGSGPEVLAALVAARDAAAASITLYPLPYENADVAINEVIANVAAVSGESRQEAIASNIEDRVDASINHDTARRSRDAAMSVLDELEDANWDLLDEALAEEERAAEAAYEVAMEQAAADLDAAIAAAVRTYETAVGTAENAVDRARAAFEFDSWVSGAFALADAYVVLHDIGVRVESEAEDRDDGSLAALAALEYAVTIRRGLASMFDAGDSLIDDFPRHTVLDVEAEFAEAAEALLPEAEIFEGVLAGARSRAEARVKVFGG